MSILDGDPFNDALFFPRDDAGAPPPGAVDRYVDHGDARIHVRCYPAPAARCTLLFFHGNGEIAADYDETWRRYAAFGAALAVAEFRGYGQATGTPTLRHVIDDAPAIAAAVASAGAARLPMIVMGRSLGGAAAHALYAAPTPGLAGVILESAFSHLGNLVRRRGIAPPAFTEAELTTFDPLRKLARGRLPLLVLHGAEDAIVVPAEARAAHDAAASAASRDLVFVPDRGHNDLSDAEVYWDAIAAFVDKVCPRA